MLDLYIFDVKRLIVEVVVSIKKNIEYQDNYFKLRCKTKILTVVVGRSPSESVLLDTLAVEVGDISR
jgi:hypothetical protein